MEDNSPLARSSRRQTTDPWHTFAFVSVFLAALVVAANAYVMASERDRAEDSLVVLLSGEPGQDAAEAPAMVARDTRDASGAAAAGDSAAPANEASPAATSDEQSGDSASPTPANDESTGEPAPGEATPVDEAAAEPAPGTALLPESTAEARAAGNDAAPATVAPLSTPTAEPPTRAGVEGLTIWSGGDSMSYFMTVALFQAVEARGIAPVSPANYVVSSGLLPGGPYDWFPRIEADMAAFDPDIAVFMVGANDANGAAADPAGYARLVGEAMDLFAGRQLYWVGQPPMGREDLQSSIPVVNGIFAEEAAKRDWVTFVETWSIMAEPGGAMLWYDESGQLLRAETDGIHVTPTGGARMAQPVIEAVLP